MVELKSLVCSLILSLKVQIPIVVTKRLLKDPESCRSLPLPLLSDTCLTQDTDMREPKDCHTAISIRISRNNRFAELGLSMLTCTFGGIHAARVEPATPIDLASSQLHGYVSWVGGITSVGAGGDFL